MVPTKPSDNPYSIKKSFMDVPTQLFNFIFNNNLFFTLIGYEKIDYIVKGSGLVACFKMNELSQHYMLATSRI